MSITEITTSATSATSVPLSIASALPLAPSVPASTPALHGRRIHTPQPPSLRDALDPVARAGDVAASARAVARMLVAIAVPLAKACARFCDGRAWEECGYARQSDVSREVLGRSPRWLRQQAALGRALLALPSLERAMLGADGGTPLGVVAAGEIASVADDDTLEAWIARARAVPVRQLVAEVRAVRAASREASASTRARMAGRPAPAGFVSVGIWAPEAVHRAFDEALDLHRAICGREEPVASFVEALVAEGGAGVADPDDAPRGVASPVDARDEIGGPSLLGATPVLSLREWLRRRGLGGGEPVAEASSFVALVESTLRGPRVAEAAPGAGGLDEIRALLELTHAGEVLLAECLLGLRERHAVTGRDFETFAAEHVGVSPAYARKLLAIARATSRWSGLAATWRAGEVTSEQALLLGRVFGRGGHDDASVAQWIDDARAITVRRLRDHVRLVARERALGARASAPPSDAAWWASLLREPGMTAARIRHLVTFAAEHAASVRVTWRRFVLEPELAARFELIMRERAGGERRWFGLVALLLEYVDEHDRGPRKRVLERDGYRCAVPGCTSRANLDQHHVVYRSRGGGNEAENLVTLCEFHHHRGVHAGLVGVTGRAPLGLTFRIGRRGSRVRWYRADRLVPREAPGEGAHLQ